VKISVNGKEARLTDLRPDATISYRTDKNMKVTEIRQFSGYIGTIKSIGKGKIDIGGGRTYELHKSVMVSLDGREAKVEDLENGQVVKVGFGEDGKKVVQIDIVTDKK
jgi:hypothetical protein